MHSFPCKILQFLAMTLTLAGPGMPAAAEPGDPSAASALRELGKPDQ